MQKKEHSLIDVLYLLVKRRKIIIYNLIIICFITAIFSLIMPKTYTSTCVILPPEGSETNNFLSILAELPVGGLGFGGSALQQSYSYLAMLNSRTMADRIINRFKLKERYKSKTLEEARLILRNKIQPELRDDGLISLQVEATTGFFSDQEEEDSTRNLAAKMANYFIEQLDEINKNIQSTQARYNRIFIEKRFNQNKKDLEIAELEYQHFQEKHNAISLPEQILEAIKAASEIQAKIIAGEVEISALEHTMNAGHPQILLAKAKLTELKKSLRAFQEADNNLENYSNPLFPAFEKAPELGAEMVRLTRELKTQSKLYEFLIQQYEQAKIQEAKDTPTVQVLDVAIPAEFRTKPVRSLMVILGGIVSILISFLIIGILEYLERIRYSKKSEFEKLDFIVRVFKSDFQKMVFWKNN